MWNLLYFQWGHFQLQDSSGVGDLSSGVKKWAIFGNIFHWGDQWGGSHWVTETGVSFLNLNRAYKNISRHPDCKFERMEECIAFTASLSLVLSI